MSTFENIIVENKDAVGIITLNRPKMLNALSFGVFREIAAALEDLEADDKIGCILLTGSEKAFAAGADIKEMQPKTFIDMFSSDFAAVGGDRVAKCRKPTIAAVAGYALGGGQGQGGDQPRIRNAAVRRAECRAQFVSLDLCAGRPFRGHGGIH